MTEERPDPVDAAWRIHAAQADWTGKVDSKASFALAVESALMVGVIGLTGGNRRLANLEGCLENALFWTGIIALLVGLLAVVWVVRPRLRSKTLAIEAQEDFIFFGHSRLWTAEQLQAALETRPILPVLSRQIVRVSELNWRKHKLLQVSLEATTVGAVLIGIAAALA